MGGIQIDLEGRTSLSHLYAAGETACNGVHGANRLASNSLLESLVFAQRAAVSMLADPADEEHYARADIAVSQLDFRQYENLDQYRKQNQKLVRDAIKQ